MSPSTGSILSNLDVKEMGLNFLSAIGFGLTLVIAPVSSIILLGAAGLTFANSSYHLSQSKDLDFFQKAEAFMDYLVVNYGALLPVIPYLASNLAHQPLAHAAIGIMGQVAAPLFAVLFFKQAFSLIKESKLEDKKLTKIIDEKREYISAFEYEITQLEESNIVLTKQKEEILELEDRKSKLLRKIKQSPNKDDENTKEQIKYINRKLNHLDVEKIAIKIVKNKEAIDICKTRKESCHKEVKLLEKKQTLAQNKFKLGCGYVALGLLATAAFACMFFPPAALAVTGLFIGITVGVGLMNGVYKKSRIDNLQKEIKKDEKELTKVDEKVLTEDKEEGEGEGEIKHEHSHLKL